MQEQERFTRLESKVEHFQSVVSEVEADVRALAEKVDAVKDVISQIQARRGLWMSIAAGLLGVMARGFTWI